MIRKFFLTSLLVIALAVFGVGGGLFQTPVASGDAVVVTASVALVMSCSTAGTPTAFGTLTTGSIYTSTPNSTSTLSCNDPSGCTLNLQDAGAGAGQPGLYKSDAPTDLIASASATLAAGTEGFGIQIATTTAGTGGTLNLSATYNKTGNAVGGLTTTNAAIASSSVPVNGRLVVTTHKAAISNLTSEGSYTDTLTYSCAAN